MMTLVLALPDVCHAQIVNYEELQDLFQEPVTTSVTGKPQRVSEAPAALVIITRDDIRRSPAHDIPGLIQAYAGIDVARWTAGQADIAIRGGVQTYDSRLLVLVNGRQVYLDHYGMTNWAGLGVQLEEIQQIEVVKGPNSALFGFNAVSGVINIITINPLHTQQLVTTVEGGTEGYLRLSQSAAIKLNDRFGLRLSGGYEKSDELDGLARSPVALAGMPLALDPSHHEAAGEMYGSLDDRTEGTISGSYTDTKHLEVPTGLFALPLFYKFRSVGARIAHDAGWGLLSARLTRNWSSLDVEAPQAAGASVKFRNRVFIASADALIRAGTSDTLRIGIEYRRNILKIVPGYAGTPHYDVFGGSAMWEHRFSDAITFTVASRLDNLTRGITGDVDQPTIFTKQDFERSYRALSLNSALLIKVDPRSVLRLEASGGIQAPSLYSSAGRIEYTIPGIAMPFVSAGDPAIDPARITSVEVGVLHTFDWLNSHLEMTAFYNRTTDVISIATLATPPRSAPPATPFVLTTSDNVGTFRAFGLEASLAGQFGPRLNWALNYTWTKAHQDIVGNTDAYFARPLALGTSTPEHKIKAQLSYERGPWLASAATRYISGSTQLIPLFAQGGAAFGMMGIHASLSIDAKLALQVSNAMTIALAAENLTDARSADMSPPDAERRVRATLQVRY